MSEAHGGVRFFPFSQEVLAALRRLMDFSDSDELEIREGQVPYEEMSHSWVNIDHPAN